MRKSNLISRILQRFNNSTMQNNATHNSNNSNGTHTPLGCSDNASVPDHNARRSSLPLVISDETPLDLRTTNITRLDILATQAATHMSSDARFPSLNETFRQLLSQPRQLSEFPRQVANTLASTPPSANTSTEVNYR